MFLIDTNVNDTQLLFKIEATIKNKSQIARGVTKSYADVVKKKSIYF